LELEKAFGGGCEEELAEGGGWVEERGGER